jgi:hypothetical protein
MLRTIHIFSNTSIKSCMTVCSPKEFFFTDLLSFSTSAGYRKYDKRKKRSREKERRDDNYGRDEAFAVLLLALDCCSCPTLFPAVGISINGVTP